MKRCNAELGVEQLLNAVNDRHKLLRGHTTELEKARDSLVEDNAGLRRELKLVDGQLTGLVRLRDSQKSELADLKAVVSKLQSDNDSSQVSLRLCAFAPILNTG